MNNLVAFDFNGSTLDYALLNGEPLFNLTYVGGLLGIVNPRTSIDTSDSDYVIKLDDSVVGLTYNRNLNNRGELFLTEAGLYRLIGKSEKLIAEKFQKWVCKEVLPSIRKTGSYSLVETPMERLMRNSTNQLETATALVEILKVEAKKQEALTTEVKQLTSTVKTQNVQIAEMQPKVQYCDIVLSCPDLVTVTVIAKDYGKSAMWLNNYLKDKKIIFKQGDIWLPYQKYAKLGLTKTKTATYKDNNGNEHAKTHSYWTQKGRLFIYDLLKQDNIFPLIEQE